MTDVRVRGNASSEELAAVLAVVRAATADPSVAPLDDPYHRWRVGRLAALRRTTEGDVRG